MNTKIFCDIAELKIIKKFNKKKIVKGFTTNPSLMRKAGAKDYKLYSNKILKICKNKYETEYSGNATLKNIRKISNTGINRISVGAITHSSKSFDVSLELSS